MPRDAAATPASACPQARQKRLPGAAGSPHAGHTTAGAPHSTPKRSLPPGPRRAPCASPLRTSKPQRSRPDSLSRWPFHGTPGSSWRAGDAGRAPGLLPPWPRRPLRRYGPDRPLPSSGQKITATTHLPCPLAHARRSFRPAELAGHGGRRPCPPARHRIGHYAHPQQCARLAVLSHLFGRELICYQSSGKRLYGDRR